MDASILDSVRAAYKDDKFFGPVIAHPERYPAYTLHDDLIFYRDRLCIPANDRTTRETLLATYHDDRNHFGDRKTRAAITVDYFWPGIINDVDTYIRSCDSCARKKSTIQTPAGFLHPLPVPTIRFLEIALDFVVSLSKSKGFDSVLIMTDRLTNYCKIEPLKTIATA
jgi:putative transposase